VNAEGAWFIERRRGSQAVHTRDRGERGNETWFNQAGQMNAGKPDPVFAHGEAGVDREEP
jgi:hypothetical protein